MEQKGNLPEKKYSTGSISATIWKNQAQSKTTGQPVEFKTITLQRRYKDKSGEWQSSGSFRTSDLPKAALVLNKAYEFLLLRESANDEPEDIEIEDIY
ncbi:MAG: hypothetical protein ABIG95_05790 [Candidatus Woesearchaeota archaeon]